MEIANQNFSIP